jgi:RsmE family RNA methyltransferase
MDSPSHARVKGRQLAHIHTHLKAKVGDTLCVGLLNQKIGSALIEALDKDQISLNIDWHSKPPAPLPLTLIIGLPRPKMLKRIIQTATTMGVKKLYFIHSWKVEKSFWQSPWLKEEKILENCILGLEQAKDTVLPEIHLRKRFKPFVEDELPELSRHSRKIIAHPGEPTPCPVGIKEQTTLVIGPEGGFTPYELNKFKEADFQSVHLGERILRVETAVPVLLSRLFHS